MADGFERGGYVYGPLHVPVPDGCFIGKTVEVGPKPKKGTLGKVFFLPFERLEWDDSKHWGQVEPKRVAAYIRRYRAADEAGPFPFTLVKTGALTPVDVIPGLSGRWEVRNGRHRVLAALAAGMAGVWCREFVDNKAPQRRESGRGFWRFLGGR